MADRLDISIIGPGVVGGAVCRLAHRAGYRVVAVAGGRRPGRAEELAEAVGAKVLSPREAAEAAPLVLLTVVDAAIGDVCDALEAEGGLENRPIIAHCSGALSSEALISARRAGCPAGSMHPLQTFPNVEAALDTLPGSYFFIEGDAPAVSALEQLARDIGGKPVRIDPAAKGLYHAAAVMCCNYMTALLDAALELYQKVGLDDENARKAMGPLVRATVRNVLDHGPAEALTGPIARADTQTLRRHLDAMDDMDDLKKLYRILGRRTVEIALRKGTIDQQTRKKLLDVLGG